MSETKTKLNLKALGNKSQKKDIGEESSPVKNEDVNTIPEENSEDTIGESHQNTSSQEATEQKETKTFSKISLGNIKKGKQNTQKKEAETSNVAKENNSSQEQNKKPDHTDTQKQTQEEISQTPTEQSSQDQEAESSDTSQEATEGDSKIGEDMEEKTSPKKEEKKENDSTSPEKQSIPEEEVHFSNYISSFETQSNKLIKRIQNFKYTPKTRTGLVVGLIICTSLGIAGLMVFYPEKHSYQIYKASILDIIESQNKKNTTPSPTPQNNKKIQNTGEVEQEETSSGNIQKENTGDIEKKEAERDKVKEFLQNKYSR